MPNLGESYKAIENKADSYKIANKLKYKCSI